MSKKVAILEGDKSRRFGGVKYLRTDLSGGGTCEWVPESERKLTTKTVKKNGTYNISDEKPNQDGQKYYGFSQFTVNVKNSTTGRKNPSTGGDGNEYSVKPNEDTGMLEETVLPSSIRIVTQPSKTEYNNGESISINGAIVKAYKADGMLWEADGYNGGVIPSGELTLDPTTASGGGGGEGGYSSGLPVKDKVPMPYNADAIVPSFEHLDRGEWTTSNWLSHVLYPTFSVIYNETDGIYLGNIAERIVIVNFNDAKNEVVGYRNTTDVNAVYSDKQYTYNGKTVYYCDELISHVIHGDYGVRNLSSNVVEIGSNPKSYINNSELGQIAWTIRYGEHHGAGSQEEITVKWNRPEDEKELTDTFNITVTSGSNTGGNTGENNTGGGGGSW